MLVRHIKMKSRESKYVPPFEHLSVIAGDTKNPLANIAFHPILMAPPSDYSPIYITLKCIKECVNTRGERDKLVYFDMSQRPWKRLRQNQRN